MDLITIAMLLVIMFFLGQTFSLFNYELTVAWGLQESSEEVGDIGVSIPHAQVIHDCTG